MYISNNEVLLSKNSLKCFKDQKESHKLKSLNLQIVQNFVPS